MALSRPAFGSSERVDLKASAVSFVARICSSSFLALRQRCFLRLRRRVNLVCNYRGGPCASHRPRLPRMILIHLPPFHTQHRTHCGGDIASYVVHHADRRSFDQTIWLRRRSRRHLRGPAAPPSLTFFYISTGLHTTGATGTAPCCRRICLRFPWGSSCGCYSFRQCHTLSDNDSLWQPLNAS